MSTPEEEAAALERRRVKDAEKAKNHARFADEIVKDEQPLADGLRFAELQAEHARLRTKIAEMQTLVITGRFDHKIAADYERRFVAVIHRIEEKARMTQTGGAHVPKPGDAAGPEMR
ncbi:MAG: hypothetical protein ACYDCK_10395 [Thermoplasmatota archaeon]